MKSTYFFVFIFFFQTAFSSDWQEAFLQKIESGERPAWMMNQILSDLKPFTQADLSIEKIDQLGKQSREFILHCVITENKITFKNEVFNHTERDIHKILSKLTKLVQLPDIEFLICILDSYHNRRSTATAEGPIFTFAKRDKDTSFILMPDREALLGYAPLLKEVEEGRNLYPYWTEKLEKAIWRGGTTGFLPDPELVEPDQIFDFPRVKLIQVSKTSPQLVDALFLGTVHINERTTERLHELEYVTEDPLPVQEHLKYKYQILVDGYTCAFSRAYWQLFSNSAILKQETADYQWYYKELRPFVHYIPIKKDFSDLVEKIEWAKKNDGKVQKMVKNANEFAYSHLRYEDIMLYLYLLLTEYGKIQNLP